MVGGKYECLESELGERLERLDREVPGESGWEVAAFSCVVHAS